LANSRRSGLLAAALALHPVLLLAQAQGPLVLAGRLVAARGPDSSALRGAMVVAHRLGVHVQGPVDSALTDPAGRFRFVIPRPESTALYVVSSRHAGIGYFSEPFGRDRRAGADRITLVVYDTAAAGPPLAVSVRHLVITRREADGTRKALDIVQVSNAGTRTRVSADSLAPTWRMRLPAGVTGLEVGESDVSPGAVRLEGGELVVAAPFPPGEKQIVVSYLLPRGRRLRIPIDQPTARLELLVEDSGAAPVGGLRVAEPMAIEGRAFQRFSADRLGAGASPELRFGPGLARELWWLAVAAAAAGLLAGLVAVLRRPAPAAVAAAPVAADRDAILRRIVALDERYDGREAQTPPEEWAAYRARREALKAELARHLARS
jgi:hypothetical protein